MTDYYVDGDSGSNGNTGLSPAQAWETITYGVANISAGDTLYIITTVGDYADSFTVTNDYSANPVTITAYTPADPPIITSSAPWVFSGADGWTIEHMIFDGWSMYYGPIRLGDTLCTDIIVQDCWLRHATGHGLSVTGSGVSGLTVLRCKFRDIRSRSGVINRNGISVWGNVDDVYVADCIFEDMGSDGIHVHSGTTCTDFLVEDCVYFVNRPYSTTGSSLYNGDTTWWQNYSSNASEEGNDIWQVAVGGGESFTVRRCAYFGFYPYVPGQDASSNHYGYGFIAQYDTDAYYNYDCMFYDCHWGAIFSYGSGTWAGGLIDGAFIHRSQDEGVWSHGGNALHNLTVTNNCIIDNAIAPMNFRNTLVADCSGNICTEDPDDRTGNSGAANVDYNLWIDGTPSDAFFQGANDYSDHTLEITEVDGLGGQLTIVNDINTITLCRWGLKCHPNLSHLETDLGIAIRGWSVALDEYLAPDEDGQGGVYSLELS